MSDDDFDIDGLASYLHLTPVQVQRLASRDKLPGRKVAGRWRFSRADVHHWLEERIGISDGSQLQQVEGVLVGHQSEVTETPATLTEMLDRSLVFDPIPSRSRWSVIDKICQHAAEAGVLWDAPKMAAALRAREELHPTALDNGVALLHPRRPNPGIVPEPFLLLARSPQGIPFGGPRGNLTDIFFLIASIEDQGHLRTLARLSRLLSHAETLHGLRHAEDASAMYELFCRADAALDTT